MKTVLLAAMAVLGAAANTAPAAKTAPAAPPPPAKPSAAEAAKVAAYYFEGKGEGPILVKTLACLKVDEEAGSPTKNECVQPVTGPVPKGAELIAWTQWLVPVGAKYDDAQVEFLLDGQVRETRDIENLSESLRMRAWQTARASKPGNWTIKVVRGAHTLASVDVKVK